MIRKVTGIKKIKSDDGTTERTQVTKNAACGEKSWSA